MPTSVQIGPYQFTVADDQIAHDRQTAQDGSRAWGTISYRYQRIILDPEQSEQHKRVTLLHEIMHGCEDLSDWRHDKTEEVIRMLAAPLLDVLRRNPDLVAYLTAEA